MAEKYKKFIKDRGDLEFIHLSFDNTEDAAEEWAKSFKQPWPIILKEDIDEEVLVDPYFPNGRLGLPTYLLIDADGKEITRGFDQALAAVSKKEG